MSEKADKPAPQGDELPIKRFASESKSKFGLEKIWAEGAGLQRISRAQMATQLSALAWRSFAASPLTAFLTLLTVTVVLSLFGAFILLFQNISLGVSSSTGGVSLRLFLYDGTPPQEAAGLAKELQSADGVSAVRVITKDDALKEFRQALGDDAALLDGLDAENPLPASLEVRFSAAENLNDKVDQLVGRYKTNRLVEHVQYSQSLVGQFAELLRLVRIGGIAAIVLMLLVTAFVVAITIRLALYAHRHEIQIMRLVGATRGFIQAPFLIEGAAEGLLGSVAALIILFASYRAGARALLSSELAAAFELKLHFLPVSWILLFLLLGPLLGLAGSYLAVSRFSEE